MLLCGGVGCCLLCVCVYTWCRVVAWCRVWLCGVVCLGACTHVVLCVVWAVRVCVLCCGVRHGLARGKTLHVLIQHASVRTVRTPPCVPATGPHVEHMRARCRCTRRRPDGAHGGVLNRHMEGFSRACLSLFLLSLFLLSLSLFSSLLFSLVSPLLSFVLSPLFSFFPSSFFSLFTSRQQTLYKALITKRDVLL